MPFNISNPVLFYNKKMFAAAGLDPEKPPVSLDDVRADSEALVNSGAATYGVALDSNFDSGGGWYLEQWFAKAGKFYADNQNGRAARATKVLYDNDTGVSLLTFLQSMLNDGLAVNVGDNTSGFDNLLKLGDKDAPAAMTIATSAAIGPVLSVLASGQFPQLTGDDLGVAPMPGPDGKPGALVGGASLWVVDSGDDVRTAAAWDFTTYLTECPGAEPVGVGDRLPAGSNRRANPRPAADDVGDRPAASKSPTTSCCRHRMFRRPSALSSGRCSRCAPSPLRVSRRSSTVPTWRRRWPTRPSQADALIADYNSRNG